MNLRVRLLYVLSLLVFSSHLTVLHAASVTINEIYYNPVEFPEHYYEWIEIYNADAFDIDISSWSFRVGKTTYTFNTDVTPRIILSAESFAVLVTSRTSFIDNHPGYGADIIEFSKTVRLSNSGKFIALLDELNGFVDSLTYDPGWNNKIEGKSIERISIAGGSEDPLNWQESSDMGGTPGMENSIGINTGDDSGDTVPDENDESEEPIIITAGSFTAVITEVSPSESGSRDWVEIFIVAETDISVFSLYERETEIKQFPSVTVSRGSYLVVHCNTDGVDEISDINGNGYLDFYSSDAGLTGTDNVISLRESDGAIVDAVIFSNRDNESFVPKTSYDACTAALTWEPQVVSGETADYEAGSFDWSGGSSQFSIARVRAVDGFPIADRPVSRDALVLNRYPNPGGGYGHTDNLNTKIVEVVEPNPFSPYDSNPAKQFAHINFNVPAGAVKTLYLFDVHGREKIKLIDNDNGREGQSWHGIDSGQLLWNGRDSSGNILPIGIYIVYMRAIDPANGAKHTSKDTVVVGRQLR